MSQNALGSDVARLAATHQITSPHHHRALRDINLRQRMADHLFLKNTGDRNIGDGPNPGRGLHAATSPKGMAL